jgi:septum formation protein
MPDPPIILASASPRRAYLLREAGIDFEVIPSSASELAPGALEPYALCMQNATRKATAVAVEHPDALIIGCDTIVCLDNCVFGKPKHTEEAVAFLGQLQGRSHIVLSGLSLICQKRKIERCTHESTDVVFRSMTNQEIKNYLKLIDPLDKAGGYAAQEHTDLIIDRVEGSFANVMGLPIERLQKELQRICATFRDETVE